MARSGEQQNGRTHSVAEVAMNVGVGVIVVVVIILIHVPAVAPPDQDTLNREGQARIDQWQPMPRSEAEVRAFQRLEKLSDVTGQWATDRLRRHGRTDLQIGKMSDDEYLIHVVAGAVDEPVTQSPVTYKRLFAYRVVDDPILVPDVPEVDLRYRYSDAVRLLLFKPLEARGEP